MKFKTFPRIRRRRNRSTTPLVDMVAKALSYPFLTGVVLVSLLPLVWTALSAFKTNQEVLSSALRLPGSFRLENFISIFEQTSLGAYYWNSISITALTIVVGLLFFSMSAYVFARFDFPMKRTLFSLLTLCLLIPVTAIIFPVYLFINRLGLYNTKTGVILVYTALSMPVVLYVLRSFFLSIPREMEESAYIDGANFAQSFFGIVLPLSVPGLTSSAVIIYMTAWNDFLYNLVLTTGLNARTVPVALTSFLSMYGNDYGQLFAASLVVILPSVVLFVMLQRKISEALIAGAVKG